MAMNGSDVLILVNTGTAAVPVYEAVGSQRVHRLFERRLRIALLGDPEEAKRAYETGPERPHLHPMEEGHWHTSSVLTR